MEAALLHKPGAQAQRLGRAALRRLPLPAATPAGRLHDA